MTLYLYTSPSCQMHQSLTWTSQISSTISPKKFFFQTSMANNRSTELFCNLSNEIDKISIKDFWFFFHMLCIMKWIIYFFLLLFRMHQTISSLMILCNVNKKWGNNEMHILDSQCEKKYIFLAKFISEDRNLSDFFSHHDEVWVMWRWRIKKSHET